MFAYAFWVSKPGNIIVIAAALIVAVHLAREDKILNTPKVMATMSDAIVLAKTIYHRTLRTYPELFRD